MPRIDPERLLKCLQPLLEATSGAIKSIEEVDKILGLMSKFSKKLVSKCIYINILNSTNDSVLDLFMQRGGWSLVFGWANDAVNSKNFSLLKEIVTLLLRTPTTLQRLRENKFPILIKSLSKDCEDEETRNLAKQVVAKWIIVAKGGELKPTVQPITQSVGIPMQVANINFSIDQNIPLDQRGVQDLGNIGGMNADSLLNIDPTFMPDAENQLMDFDISHNDLPDIDFNLDILSKVVDPQNLDVSLPAVVSTPVVDHKPGIVNMEVVHQNNTIPTVPSVIPIQPIKEEVIEMLQVQPAPKIFIKTIAGQRTVSLQSLPPIPPSTPEGQYCVIIKDGRNYLMKLKDDTKPVVTGVVPEPLVQAKPTETRGHDTADSKEKRKHLMKEPLSSPNKAGQSGMKTYPPSAKASNPIVQDVKQKNVDQSSKLDGKDKDKKHSKEKSGDGHKKSKSSSSNSKAAAAAALVKKQEEDEKLREEIRKQKALMKKRQKEAVKQKQQEKDQETLKKLNLTPSTTSPSGSMKIPKIPKKSTSFADAIGIPGIDGAVPVDKIKKVSTEKSTNKSEDNPTPPSPTKKFYGKEEPEEPNEDKPKERRHKAKVFVSSKSKSDDLLKAMTESGKSKTSKEKEKVKEKEEVKANNVGLGNSIPAVPPPSKVSKRLSTETIEKPGDSKKIKLSDSKSEKLKDKESKDSAAAKEKERKKASAIALKESSLFMDMLNASSDVSKPSKRKRRPSIGSEKDKNDPESPVEKSKKLVKEDMDSPAATPDIVLNAEEPAKPVFNFYRDTLNDSEEENKESDTKTAESTSNSASEDRPPEGGEEGSFTPQDNDGKLKSALCLHRSKNKPKKSVRWRQEDELKEFHFFEMDETERVNVTKQKDFTEMSQNEKAIEKTGMLRRKAAQEEEQRNEWRLVKIKFNDDILQPNCTSQERYIQEEREKNVLGLFLPPGATLPETASEPDTTIPVERNDPRPMPVEDVIGITKVCDYRTKKWPAPVGFMGYGNHASGHSEVEDIPQNHSMNNTYQHQPTPTPDYNPWNANANLGFNVNVPPVGVPNMVDITAFQQFAPPTMNVNLIGSAPPPAMFPNPFAYPPPPMIPAVTGPPPGLDGFGINHNRDNRLGHPPSNRGGRFNEADQRRNFHNRDGGRDRVGNRGSDRDYREDRGAGGRDRDRDRDRDYRRRDRDNFKDNERHDRNREFRPGNRNNIRKDIPCRYYKKGFCQNGSRCEFSHDASNNLDENRSNAHSRDTFDSGRSNRSPDSGNDVDLRQEMNSRDSWTNERQNSADEPDATSFALPPSSPTEPEVPGFGPATESTKVIPV